MKLIFSADIPIRPQSKQSARFGKGRVYTKDSKAKYVKDLAAFAKKASNHEMAEGPVYLVVSYMFKHSKKIGSKATRPDIDNLLKPVKDALSGIVYKDDSQIVRLSASKNYSDKNLIIVNVYAPKEREVFND